MDEIYKIIAEQYNLPVEVVKEAYMSFYKYIRENISNTLLKDKELEVEDLNISFNIPSIGKLYFDKNKYLKIKNNYVKNKNK